MMTRRLMTAIVVVLLALSALTLINDDDRKHLTALFSRAVSFYPGAQVKVLGVPVGEVTNIRVEGTHVRVDIAYDSERALPANVHAVIVPPSLLGDRFVQLTPPYTGGKALADGATVPLARTSVPVEVDETYRGLNDLASALGPEGANRDGELAQLIKAAAAGLKGNGRQLNTTLGDLSGAVDTLAAASPDMTGTITNLSKITKNLSANDSRIRTLVKTLAAVSTELNGQRTSLRKAVTTLGDALDDLGGFVHEHRPALATAIKRLARTTGTVTRHRADLAEILDVTPLAIANVYNVNVPQNWDPRHPDRVRRDARTGALNARGNTTADLATQLGHTVTALCGQLPADQQRQLAPLCGALRQAGGDLGLVISGAVAGEPPSTSLADLLVGGPR
jgi:phospholipid/cholesterol/gamma-HCH transport system substrate-binding protein